ncbi:MAG: DUF4330 domain-containing protein [Oscillospiraceae bacterium]|nr:DUF4330 domain-containing protein [Oscillospiraceae bacterium]
MEQKRRRFNWFDGLVVLLVLGAAFLWFFVINRTEAVEEATFAGDRAMYYVEVTNLTGYQAAQVEIGDALRDAAQHLPIGRVVEIDIRPFEIRTSDDQNQVILWQTVEDRYTMILTVETEVEETPAAIYAEGEVIIRGGTTLHFTGPGFAFSGGTILGWSERGE